MIERIKESFRKALLTDTEINTTNFAKVLKHAYAAIDEASARLTPLDLEIQAFFVELVAIHVGLSNGSYHGNALDSAKELADQWLKERRRELGA